MKQAESQRVQHTSGPWDVFHASHGSGKWTIAVIKGRKEVIAWPGFDSSDFPEDALANATLIAAAPELLAALEMCVRGLRHVEGNSNLVEFRKKAEAAIRKAKDVSR